MENALFYQLALSFVPKLKKDDALKLLEYLGSAEAIFNDRMLKEVPDLNEKVLKGLLNSKPLQRAEQELKLILENKLHVQFILDKDYPFRLRECADAPLILYSKGVCDLNAKKVVSIVGTRRATPLGRDMTEILIRDLAKYYPDIVIVSGLAYGIDVISHQAALKYELRTAAVVAHGLQEIYPPAHRKIANEILSGEGIVLSELPWGSPSQACRFIQRNRIVAGLCDACIVMESAEEGGSLTTAKLAAGYDRAVMAYPGRPSDTYSKGCNQLIKNQTAALIESAEDVLKEMHWNRPRKRTNLQQVLFPELDPLLNKVYDLLIPGEKQSGNELSLEAGLKISETLSVLIQLEMVGLAESLPGGFFRRKEV
jgi:DNA processing protein